MESQQYQGCCIQQWYIYSYRSCNLLGLSWRVLNYLESLLFYIWSLQKLEHPRWCTTFVSLICHQTLNSSNVPLYCPLINCLSICITANILYRTRYHSWLKSVVSFKHMLSGSCETQLLATVLHTTQRKYVLSDLEVSVYPIHLDTPLCLDAPCMFG